MATIELLPHTVMVKLVKEKDHDPCYIVVHAGLNSSWKEGDRLTIHHYYIDHFLTDFLLDGEPVAISSDNSFSRQ